MKKIISADDAVALIQNNSSLMVGGFLKCGCPHTIIDCLVEKKVKNLTLIANDTSFPDSDRGKLIVEKMVKTAIVSHIGTNPETGRQMSIGELDVRLVPQGTLAEIIRAGGAGLGGILTPTGIGTVVEKGKSKIEIEGKEYLIEKSLKADVAIIYGTRVDKFGNIAYEGSTRNFNPIMAMAADLVIVEAEEIIDGHLSSNEIVVPGIFVDYIVQGER